MFQHCGKNWDNKFLFCGQCGEALHSQTESKSVMTVETQEPFTIDNSGLSQENLKRFQSVMQLSEECLQPKELRDILLNGNEIDHKRPIVLVGVEPGGKLHISQGLLKVLEINTLTKNGFTVVLLLADWFAVLNDKLGGDLKKAKAMGDYYLQIWRACGLQMEHVQIQWTSDLLSKYSSKYWLSVLEIGRKFSVNRIKGCSETMGIHKIDGVDQTASSSEELTAAQIFYPCMQIADAFFFHADIIAEGLDQKPVNLLIREYAQYVNSNNKKPIILSTHILSGLSGTDGNGASIIRQGLDSIFIDDSEQEVNSKIKKAFCEPRNIEKNPCLEYIRYIVFPIQGSFTVVRDEKNGGTRMYSHLEEIEKDFSEERLHPADLKAALMKTLNDLLKPIREHLKNNEEASKLAKQIKNFKLK